MGFRDRLRDAVIEHTSRADGSPALAHRATQVASATANLASEHSHLAAAGIASLGAAAVAAEGALTNYVYPRGEYATFRGD
ncbi:hypothetical protein JK359_33385 [Streptomyces actinomycinicus]|uniref:Uncharacterized protein n=1 Tax=Streptomyces actinomycinicus TaxID=1695166 RepID=A0A937JQK7_9ACTN|nr:hypothetical protein [Streptomyces actinomycinicus]MBL1086800.1 hypothetical protein [Streptomyces actinomycinicus]